MRRLWRFPTLEETVQALPDAVDLTCVRANGSAEVQRCWPCDGRRRSMARETAEDPLSRRPNYVLVFFDTAFFAAFTAALSGTDDLLSSSAHVLPATTSATNSFLGAPLPPLSLVQSSPVFGCL